MVIRSVFANVTHAATLFLRKLRLCFATGVKFKIRRDSNCNTKNVIYLAYCKKCYKQGVGSCIEWKPRLRNYKSHIKKKKALSVVPFDKGQGFWPNSKL